MGFAISFTRRLKAPRALVYRTITDFENLQDRLPKIFHSIQVLKRNKNYIITEEEFSVLGSVITQRSKHVVKVPTKHTVEILTGELAGSKIVERYSDDSDDGTIVNVDADFSLGGLLSFLPSFIIRPMIEDSLNRVFTELEDAFQSGAIS
ncbi:MAG: SRPBCC family protein [Thaumarchaeota archaeon]|nr:SRPBCC family protein [Nitrososphaerota archaeon]